MSNGELLALVASAALLGCGAVVAVLGIRQSRDRL
jgi:hypothetical protein